MWGSYKTIWSSPLTNAKWHSVVWPTTMTVLQGSDFKPICDFFLPNSFFYRIMRGYHRTFVTGVACGQGTLTPPDTRSHPIWDLNMFSCWDQFLYRTCRYFSGLCYSNIPQYFLDFAIHPLNCIDMIFFLTIFTLPFGPGRSVSTWFYFSLLICLQSDF